MGIAFAVDESGPIPSLPGAFPHLPGHAVTGCLLCPEHKTRALRDGGVTCWPCHDGLGQSIGEVAWRYVRLDASPSRAGDLGRRAPGFGSRPPLNIHIAALRDRRTTPDRLGEPHNAHRMLGSWANYVRVERSQDYVLSEGLAGATNYLLANLDWITRQGWVPELAAQVRVVVSQLRSATGEPNPKPVGWCIEPIITAGTFTDWCNHPLFPPHEGELNIRCGGCGVVYDPLRQIKLRIQNERDPAAGDPCAECGHSSSQHDNEASGARPCNALHCGCRAHRKVAA